MKAGRIKDSFNRKTIAVFRAIAVVLLALTLAELHGCTRKRAYRVGIVSVNAGHAQVIEGFKEGLAGAGLKEGKNVTYLYRGRLNLDQVDAELARLVAERVDLILAVSTPVARKARDAVRQSKIPVVFAPVLYPVKSGLVESLSRPGGNLTGIQSGGSTAKALEFHRSAFPDARRILVPLPPGDEAAALAVSELSSAAPRLGIELAVRRVDNLQQLTSVLATSTGIDSIWLLNSPFLVSNVDLFVTTAIRRRLPLSSGTSQYREGIMVSYGQNIKNTGMQAARLAQRILQGIPPAEIPVETAEFFLGVNLKSVQAIGATIPDDVLAQAFEIVR